MVAFGPMSRNAVNLGRLYQDTHRRRLRLFNTHDADLGRHTLFHGGVQPDASLGNGLEPGQMDLEKREQSRCGHRRKLEPSQSPVGRSDMKTAKLRAANIAAKEPEMQRRKATLRRKQELAAPRRNAVPSRNVNGNGNGNGNETVDGKVDSSRPVSAFDSDSRRPLNPSSDPQAAGQLRDAVSSYDDILSTHKASEEVDLRTRIRLPRRKRGART